jgi:hypothetical protein
VAEDFCQITLNHSLPYRIGTTDLVEIFFDLLKVAAFTFDEFFIVFKVR